MSGLEIKILPDVSEENGWRRFTAPEPYREWAAIAAPFAPGTGTTDIARGTACEYRLIPNMDTFMESLIVCFPDGPMLSPVWVLHVQDELVGETAMRMALRAFVDMRKEMGEEMPASLEVVA